VSGWWGGDDTVAALACVVLVLAILADRFRR